MNILKKCVSYYSHSSFLWLQILKYGYTREWNSFFTCYLKVVLDRFFENLEFVLDGSISHYFPVIRCRSLSFVITHCHSLSLVVPLIFIRCTSRCLLSLVLICWNLLYQSFSLVVTRCHSMYHSSVFYKWSIKNVIMQTRKTNNC